MATKSNVIYSSIYPRIKTSLSQPKNIASLRSVFSEIVGRNQEALASAIPDKAVYMDARTEKKYYEILGVSAQEILHAIAEAPDIDNEWNTIKNPMYVSLLLSVFVFNELKKKEMADQAMFVCSLYMYRNVRTKYFSKVSQSTINVMNYTISRLSYKSDLKKYGSVLKMISKKNEVFINNWFVERKSDVTGIISDEIICKMINDNHRRYSTTMNTFYAEFKSDSLSGNYMNTDKDIDDEDNYMESDNVSFMVEKTTQQLMNKLSLSGYPNAVIIQHTCSIEQGCSVNNLRNILNFVYDSQDKAFEQLLRLIIQTYLFDYKKKIDDIKNPDFILNMRSYYKKQTTQNANLTELKNIIDGFIEGSGITKKINRPATINDCKKATMLYMLFFIQRNL